MPTSDPSIGQLVVYAPDNKHRSLGTANQLARVIRVHRPDLVDIVLIDVTPPVELTRVYYGENAYGFCWSAE